MTRGRLSQQEKQVGLVPTTRSRLRWLPAAPAQVHRPLPVAPQGVAPPPAHLSAQLVERSCVADHDLRMTDAFRIWELSPYPCFGLLGLHSAVALDAGDHTIAWRGDEPNLVEQWHPVRLDQNCRLDHDGQLF